MNPPEQPLYIEGVSGPLFGIVTPAPESSGNVVLCTGGWHGGSINGNRMVVHLARRLAASGRSVLRFDWHGAGESPGYIQYFRIDEPAAEDTIACVATLRALDARPVSLVGICVGSRSALAAAEGVEDLDSVVLVSFPFPTASTKQKRAERIGLGQAIRQGVKPSVVKGWFEPATRQVYLKFIRLRWRALQGRFRRPDEAAQEFAQRRRRKDQNDREVLVEQIGELARRGVRVMFLYGTGDAALEHFEAVRLSTRLGRLIDDPESSVRVEVVEGDLSGYSSIAAQTTMIESVAGWFAADAARP